MDELVQKINSIVWSPALIALLVGAGLYFTIRTRCVQVRRLGLMCRLLFSRNKTNEVKAMSPFQAFCVALSGRVGTGNIVGVATAIALGGPGAVFWMWVIAFLGASTAFTESTLAQKYRFVHEGGLRGGPFSYIDKGLGQRWLGIIIAALTIIGYGMLLVLLQANGVSSAFTNSFSVPPLATGIGFAVLLALVIMGGVKRIAHIATAVTPFMAATYLLMSLIIIGVNIKAVPGVFASIFTNAFAINPLVGGIIGSTIAMGVKRGLLSNEAGQGGGAIVSACADTDMPAKQGLVQAFSVYVDTLLVCTATALMILTTGTFNVIDKATGDLLYAGAPELGANYVGYTQAAIDSVFSGFGSGFVSIALVFFAFTTVMAYYLYSESSIMYIFSGNRHPKFEKAVTWIYRVVMVTLVVVGACTATDTVWTLGDIGVGLSAWVNVIALLLLFPQALACLRDVEAAIPPKRRCKRNK